MLSKINNGGLQEGILLWCPWLHATSGKARTADNSPTSLSSESDWDCVDASEAMPGAAKAIKTDSKVCSFAPLPPCPQAIYGGWIGFSTMCCLRCHRA